jgi:hypothetical protein
MSLTGPAWARAFTLARWFFAARLRSPSATNSARSLRLAAFYWVASPQIESPPFSLTFRYTRWFLERLILSAEPFDF